LDAKLIGLGLWNIKYTRISNIKITTLTITGSSTVLESSIVLVKDMVTFYTLVLNTDSIKSFTPLSILSTHSGRPQLHA
jgi:uncharacterized protein YegL